MFVFFEDITEVVPTYKYLGALDWPPNTDALYRKEQSMFWTMRS